MHNDLANDKIEAMGFDFLSDLAGWRRFTNEKITGHGAWLYD